MTNHDDPDQIGNRETPPAPGLDDGDLLLHAENDVLRWFRALDLHVLGACRADERLKPMLKLSGPSAAGEDHLMSQLSQHFEVSEVGMLVRCLCVPLVSIRVGKIRKQQQGSLLCPTHIRGHLNLTLVPSSDMRILFCGDDGCNERMAVIPRNSESSDVFVEEISADSSGRSFLLKLSDGQTSYFWCSEKSKLVGVQLLAKMKSLLEKRPSLSQLTGIHESRLDSFARHLRAYLLGSANATAKTLPTSSDPSHIPSNSHSQEPDLNSASILRSSRSRLNASQSGGKALPFYQGSLSPKSSTFKDGLSRSLSSLRNAAKEKFRRRGDGNTSLSTASSLAVSTSILSNVLPASNTLSSEEKLEDANSNSDTSMSQSLFITSSTVSSDPSLSNIAIPQLPPSGPPLISPYYCWCPPCSTSFHQPATTPILPSLVSGSLQLPPISSLLSAAGSVSFLPSGPPVEQSQPPSFDLPAVLPPSFVALPTLTQIPTFNPFMSDPIIHIPVIDVCSSGPGYLVSAGPAISALIPPLLPKIVCPLTAEAESVVEKNARETLRMLVASAPPSTQLIQVLPSVVTTVNENYPFVQGRRHGMVVTGSRGLYTGTQDVGVVANSMYLMDLASSSGKPAVSRAYTIAAENIRKSCEVEKSHNLGGPEHNEQQEPSSSPS